jgi:hypothetical protein
MQKVHLLWKTSATGIQKGAEKSERHPEGSCLSGEPLFNAEAWDIKKEAGQYFTPSFLS